MGIARSAGTALPTVWCSGIHRLEGRHFSHKVAQQPFIPDQSLNLVVRSSHVIPQLVDCIARVQAGNVRLGHWRLRYQVVQFA